MTSRNVGICGLLFAFCVGTSYGDTYAPGTPPTIGEITVSTLPQSSGSGLPVGSSVSLSIDPMAWVDIDDVVGSTSPTTTDTIGQITWSVDNPALILSASTGTFTSFSIPVSLEGATITVTASISDSQMRGLDSPITRTYTVNVVGPKVKVEVRPKSSYGSGSYGSSAAVCAGGIGSNAHMADVKISTSPAVADYSISATLQGGVGVNTQASLAISSTTDSTGVIVGSLTSSDKVESATIIAKGSSATVTFDWNVSPSWTSSTGYLMSGDIQNLFQMTHHNEPVGGHSIYFDVDSVELFSETSGASTVNGNMFASFSPASSITGSTGVAITTLTTSSIDGTWVTQVNGVAYDMTVFDADAINANAQFAQRPNLRQAQQVRREFDPGDPISVPPPADATATNPSNGTIGPRNNAKVFPGQRLLFQYFFEDLDRERPVGAANWMPRAYRSAYKITLVVTNAKFTNNERTLSVNVSGVGGGQIQNLPITVDETWTGADPVTLNITVEDQGGQIPPNSGSIKDPNFSQVLTWSRAMVVPTTMVADHQNQGNLGAEVQNNLMVWYKFGNLAPAAYKGVTVLETFKPKTSDFDKAWLKPEIRNAHPNWTSEEWSNAFFNQNVPPGGMSTFTISATHFIVDTHTGWGLPINYPLALTANGLTQSVTITIPQAYECPPGKTLGSCSIMRKIGPAPGFALSMWKTGP